MHLYVNSKHQNSQKWSRMEDTGDLEEERGKGKCWLKGKVSVKQEE